MPRARDVLRFLNFVYRKSLYKDCWLWTGAVGARDYGRFWYDGRIRQATHFALLTSGRVLPNGMEPDHLCKNPICVNPLHLEVVTPQENVRRSNSPAGVNARRTHCTHGHPFNDINTGIYADSKGRKHRYCLACYESRP